MYSYKKDKIIQDLPKQKKSILDKIKQIYKNIDWSNAGHKTANGIIRILKYFPIIFLIFISTYTFLYVKGFNLNVENIGQGIYCLFSILLGIAYLRGNIKNPRKHIRKIKNYTYNFIGSILLISLPLIPNVFTYIFYGTIIFLILRIAFKAPIYIFDFIFEIADPPLTIEDEEYVIDGRSVSKEEYEEYLRDPDAYNEKLDKQIDEELKDVNIKTYHGDPEDLQPKIIKETIIEKPIYKEVHVEKQSYQTHVEESQPVVKTLKIVNARQIAHNVNYKVNEFENGKDTGRGSIHGKTGMLQNWNESSVTVKDGKWFRQYGLHGEIINSWRDPLNE